MGTTPQDSRAGAELRLELGLLPVTDSKKSTLPGGLFSPSNNYPNYSQCTFKFSVLFYFMFFKCWTWPISWFHNPLLGGDLPFKILSWSVSKDERVWTVLLSFSSILCACCQPQCPIKDRKDHWAGPGESRKFHEAKVVPTSWPSHSNQALPPRLHFLPHLHTTCIMYYCMKILSKSTNHLKTEPV